MIKSIPSPIIYLTEAVRRQYADDYRRGCMFYCGQPPSFEEYVRMCLDGKKEPFVFGSAS